MIQKFIVNIYVVQWLVWIINYTKCEVHTYGELKCVFRIPLFVAAKDIGSIKRCCSIHKPHTHTSSLGIIGGTANTYGFSIFIFLDLSNFLSASSIFKSDTIIFKLASSTFILPSIAIHYKHLALHQTDNSWIVHI